MRQYSKRRLDAARLLEEHRRKAYGKSPQLSQIDSQVSSESLGYARLLLQEEGRQTDLSGLKKRLEELSRLRSSILTENGLPAAYMEMQYACPDWRATGYIAGKQCHCFRHAAIDRRYTKTVLSWLVWEDL